MRWSEERSDSKSIIIIISWNEATAALRSKATTEQHSFSSSLHSSHIPPSYITNNFPLVASLLAPLFASLIAALTLKV